MRNSTFIRGTLTLAMSFFLFAGCSSTYDPMAPIAEDSELAVLTPRSGLDFETMMAKSDHGDYTEISGIADSASGGQIQGTVSDYDHVFSLNVPPGACPSVCELRMLVPNSGLPVYQLLPHMNFQSPIRVTLDTSKWLADGVFTQGQQLELFYMNEETREFEQLSPRVRFTADAANPTVSFITDHFSRWLLDDESL